MIVHNLIQGSPEWHAYRARHDNASDAAAMMGCSSYKTRDQLVAQYATGIVPEVDAATQRMFDMGHRFEALARPLAEAIIGEDLYPVTASLEGTRLSASFDGVTLLEEKGFEHKMLNAALREALSAPGCTGADLPMEYQVQMEQQCTVSECEKELFMASDWDRNDQLIEELHCWYTPNPALRARILAGWEQFHKDVAAWVPPESAVAVKATAKIREALPVLVFDAKGEVTACNVDEFKAEVLERINTVNTSLATDQDFADGEADAKWLRDVSAGMKAAIQRVRSGMVSVNEVLITLEQLDELAAKRATAVEKLVKARKDEIRGEIVAGGITSLREHIAELNAAMPASYMPQVLADFAGVVKNKRTVESLRNAVNTELARAKIEAGSIANRIHANVKTLHASGLVVHDAATLVLKAPDDLAAVIAQRQAAEQARLGAERERIRAEEQAKLQREQQDAMREKLLQAEREAQEGIADARAAEVLPAPLLDDLSTLAKDIKDDAAAGIDAAQVIDAAQRGARVKCDGDHGGPQCADPECWNGGEPRGLVNVVPMRAAPALAERTGTPALKLGQIAERLGFSLTADFLKGLGFEPAATDRASKLYFEADFPLILAALVRHIEGVQAKAAA